MLPRIAVAAGEGAASRLAAHCVYSILTRLGHWAELVDVRLLGEDAFDLIVFTSRPSGGGLQVSTTPRIVYDASLFGGSALGDVDRLSLAGESLSAQFRHSLLPDGDAISTDDTGQHIARCTAPGTIHALPIFLTPEIQRNAVFQECVALVGRHVAHALDQDAFLYVEPWPRGFKAALAATFDLDGMRQRDGAFLDALAAGCKSTLFACADQLHVLPESQPHIEIACHGDVHTVFNGAATNEIRVASMTASFQAAGLAPRGFSPPNLVYTSSLERLSTSFDYLRIGYMERELLFFPTLRHGVVEIPVSFYPDHALKYVADDVYHSMMDTYLRWATSRGALAVLCFHPALFPDAYTPYLGRQDSGVWRPTLSELATWWRQRRSWMDAARRGEIAAAPTSAGQLALKRDQVVARTASLVPTQMRHAESAVSFGEGRLDRTTIVVANTSATLVRDVAIPAVTARSSWPERSGSSGIPKVVAKNGFHACFYGRLGFDLSRSAGSLRAPFVAANEYLLLSTRRRPAASARSAFVRARTLLRRAFATHRVRPA